MNGHPVWKPLATLQNHSSLNSWPTKQVDFLCRVIPDISHLLLPLDESLQTHLIPAVTRRPAPNDLESDLYALPARHGGLGIRVPSKIAERELLSSQKITLMLSEHIIIQDNHSIINNQLQGSEKTIVRETKMKQTVFTTTTGQAPESSGTIKGKRIFYLANRSTFNRTWLHTTQICIPRCPCPTIWLDASTFPSKCGCGSNFNVEHALSCAKGGFPTIRHNEIRDITASLLTEVCSEVCIEPELQPVTPNQLTGA